MTVEAPAAPRFQTGSLLQLVFSVLALCGGLLSAAGLILLGLFLGRGEALARVNNNAILG